MSSENLVQMRKTMCDAWSKHQQQSILTPLEAQIVSILQQHTEYHSEFNADAGTLSKDYGKDPLDNPFLHVSLHIAIEDMIKTDRPQGVKTRYNQLLHKGHHIHDVQHTLMKALQKTLNHAQSLGGAPNEAYFLDLLAQIS